MHHHSFLMLTFTDKIIECSIGKRNSGPFFSLFFFPMLSTSHTLSSHKMNHNIITFRAHHFNMVIINLRFGHENSIFSAHISRSFSAIPFISAVFHLANAFSCIVIATKCPFFACCCCFSFASISISFSFVLFICLYMKTLLGASNGANINHHIFNYCSWH